MEEKRNGFFMKIKDWLPLLFFVFGLVSLAYTTIIRNNYAIILTIEVTLLTFVAIFYPLVIQKNIQEKKRELIKFYRTQFISNVTLNLKEIKKLKEDDYNKISQETDKIQKELENLTTFHSQINIKKILFSSIISFLISIFLLIGDLIFTPNPIHFQDITIYFLAQPGYILFWYGLHKTITLVYSWNNIISKE